RSESTLRRYTPGRYCPVTCNVARTASSARDLGLTNNRWSRTTWSSTTYDLRRSTQAWGSSNWPCRMGPRSWPWPQRSLSVASIQMVACAPYWGLTKRAAPKPAVVPRSVTPQISHLKRKTALNTRRQSTPPSDSAPLQSVGTGGREGGTITGGVELAGSGKWLMDIERVPPRVARGVTS